MNRRRLPPGWRPARGEVRPLATVPGDWPQIRMGAGPDDQAEQEYGQVDSQWNLGTLPADAPALDRSAFLPALLRSGARGAPLTLLRALRVGAGGGGGLEVVSTPMPGPDLTPVAPASDLTRYWPWLFAPGPEAGEYPILAFNAPTIVGAGATVDLVTIQELPRGMRGIVKKFGTTAANFTDLVWSFLIKGKPAEPIVALANFQFGPFAEPVDLPGSGVHLRAGDDFVVRVTNTGGAAVASVRARVDLYWWRDTA